MTHILQGISFMMVILGGFVGFAYASLYTGFVQGIDIFKTA